MQKSLAQAIAGFVDRVGSEASGSTLALITRGALVPHTSALEVRALEHPILAQPTLDLLAAWRSAGGLESVPVSQFALALSAASEACDLLAVKRSRIEVVWTAPTEPGRSGRTTAQVVRELLDESRAYVLVVGYSITFDFLGRGATAQMWRSLIAAAKRGVQLTFVLHEDARNKDALMKAWPPRVQQPRLLTWTAPHTDSMIKLHAKLLLVDDSDMLITSANLTYHGLQKNLELGLRIRGREAAEVRQRFDDLEHYAQLGAW